MATHIARNFHLEKLKVNSLGIFSHDVPWYENIHIIVTIFKGTSCKQILDVRKVTSSNALKLFNGVVPHHCAGFLS